MSELERIRSQLYERWEVNELRENQSLGDQGIDLDDQKKMKTYYDTLNAKTLIEIYKESEIYSK